MPQTIYPALRYADAPTAIDWLCEAFGFERHMVVPAGDGKIAHAELAFGDSLIMVGSNPPADADIAPTGVQQLYLWVDDPDAHHDRAVAAGVQVLRELTDQDYGSREYSAIDLEGNQWSFGTYRPSPSDPIG